MKFSLNALWQKHRHMQRAKEKFRPRLETLENRLVLATILWDGGPAGTGTTWNTAANWVGDVLPGAADDAVIGSAFSAVTITSPGNVSIHGVTSAATLQITGGSFSVAAASSTNRLTLDGGTLTGAGDMTVNSQMSWLDGTMSGTGRTIIATSATATLPGTGFKVVDRAFDNAGTVNYTGSNLIFEFGSTSGVINNLAGGILNTIGGGSIGGSSSSVSINNAGTVNRSGTGATQFSNRFNNSGTVNIQAGTLTLSAGGTHSATSEFVGVSGTTLDLGGDHSFQTGATIGDFDILRIRSGTSTYAGSLHVGSMDLQGGSFTVGGEVFVDNLAIANATTVFNGPVTISSRSLSHTGSGITTFNGSTPLLLNSLQQTRGTLTGSADVARQRSVELVGRELARNGTDDR